jgi:hypothetical protein
MNAKNAWGELVPNDGSIPRRALVAPVGALAVIYGCMAILQFAGLTANSLAGLLLAVLAFLTVLVIFVVELVALPVAIGRLLRNPDSRNWVNLACVVIGFLGFLAGPLAFVLTVIN